MLTGEQNLDPIALFNNDRSFKFPRDEIKDLELFLPDGIAIDESNLERESIVKSFKTQPLSIPAIGLIHATALGMFAGLVASIVSLVFLRLLPSFDRVESLAIAPSLILAGIGAFSGSLVGLFTSLLISRKVTNLFQINFIALFPKREADAKLKNTYLILLTILILCSFISFSLHPNANWLENFSLNVASEILGIFLVVFSIDRVIDSDKDKKRKTKEKVALHQLKRYVVRHLYFLVKLVKSSGQSQPKMNYTKSIELLNDIDLESITLWKIYRHESLLKISNLNYLDLLSPEYLELRDSLNKIIEKYSLFLQPDIIKSIEEINDSSLLFLMARDRDSARDGSLQPKALLNKSNICDYLQEYLAKLDKLITVYNQQVSGEEKIKIEQLWLDNVRAEFSHSIERA